MKAHGMKRTLCLFLSMLLLLSTAVITASAAPAADVTVKVNGVAYVPGEKICAVSVVELTLPEPVANLSAVTFSEILKDGTSAYARNFDGVLSADKKTVTVTFERGDISSNSTYKFEFETNSATDGAEHIFQFQTKMEEGVYFAENFSRFKSNAAHDLDMGGFGAAGTQPHNLVPLVKMRGWVGGVGGGYTAVTTVNGAQVFKIYGNGNNFTNLGINPEYSAPLPALRHIGELTVEFQLANMMKWADFGGVTLTSANGTTVDVYVETTAKALNGDKAFAAGSPSKIGSKTYASTDEANGWHTIKIVSDTTYTASSASYTKKLMKVTLDNTVIWETDGTDMITMPSAAHGAAGGGGVAGFSKAVPALPSSATQVDFLALWSVAGSTSLYVRYAEYKDVKGVMSIESENDPNAGISDPLTIKFGDTPKPAAGLSLADEFATQISLIKVSDSTPVTVAIDAYDAVNNEVVVTPATPLEHNTQYKLTMAARNYKLTGAGAAKEYTFTTGWEKLEATTTATAATSTNFAPTVAVESVTGAALTYDTILALYKTENGITNQVASVTTTQSALAAGGTADITVGSVSDPNPSNTATYFAKVFFVSGGDAVAEPIVIGTAPTAAVTAVGGAVSTMSETTDPDTGRLDVTGKVVGSLPNRALYVTVVDEYGATVYNDVLTNGTSGNFAFGFNLNPATGGATVPDDYTVNVKPSDQSAITPLPVTFDFSSVVPAITKLEVTGTPGYKYTMTAAYSLYDFVGRTDASVVEWWTADTAGGAYAKVGEGLTYTIPATEVGKYLKCYVIPQVSTGSGVATGTTYTTDDASIAPKYLASAPEVTAATISQAAESNTIALTYTISDPLNHDQPDPNRTVVWKFKDAGGSVVKTVTNGADRYDAVASDAGLTIFAEVTPIMTAGTTTAEEDAAALAGGGAVGADYCDDFATGAMAVSNELVIVYNASSAETTLGPSGGGGGGGGGGVVSGAGNPVEEESAPTYQSPDEAINEGTLDFTDVRGHWAESEIFELYDKGIVNGRSEYEFEPNGRITRAEFIAILVRAMGIETVSYNGSFGDVKASDWYADVLETARVNGLLEGSGGKASPNRAISREEMVTIIVRAYEMTCGEIKVGGGLLDYTDASSISGWAQQAVIKATEIALVNGTGDGRFTPTANTTRAESAVIIVRLMPHLEEAVAKAEEEAAKAEEEAAKAEEEAAKAEEEEATSDETTEETVTEEEAIVEEDASLETEETTEESTEAGAEEAPATEE